MKTYSIDYVVGNTYKNKVVKAETVSEACKKAGLSRSIVDIQMPGKMKGYREAAWSEVLAFQKIMEANKEK